MRSSIPRRRRVRGPAPALSLVRCHDEDGPGIARRLQALAYMGHSAPALAARLGVSDRVVRRVQRGTLHLLPPGLIAAVNELYDKLWDRPGTSARSARIAQLKGWVPPLAWDEDRPGDDGYAGHGIDDPGATPAPGWQRSRRRSPDDRAAEVAELVSWGLTINQGALRAGVSGEALSKIRDPVAS